MSETRDQSSSHLENGVRTAHDIADTTIRDRASSVGSSDSEGGERPVRDKLKKTSIAGLSSKARAGTDKGPHPLQKSTTSELGQPSSSDKATASSRGRPARKRSFDDLQNDGSNTASQAETDEPPPAKNGHHKRMRSRDLSSGEHVSLPGMSENGVGTPVEEESDMDAQKSPGGPGVLVDASIDDAVTPPPENLAHPESVISPKKKRSRDQFDKEHGPSSDTSALQPLSSSQKESEPDKKRYREQDQAAAISDTDPKTTIATSSGFVDASTASPFGSLASPKSANQATLSPEIKPADMSAFKSSGLSAFASSEKSPFSAVGSASNSGFGGTTSSGGFGTAAPSGGFGASSKSGFANLGATSPFGARSGAGFSSLGGIASTGSFTSIGTFNSLTTFGGRPGSELSGPPAPLGGALSPFGGAASSTSTFAGPSTTKQKAFGAPEDEDDSESGNESGSQDEGGVEAEEVHVREARLKEQTDRETGEEDEEVVIKCRAKLYFFENREWKERGVGDLKVNVRFELKEGADEEAPQYERKARLIMRTEHVHRVVLNTPIFKEMKVGNQSGDEPNGKFLNLAGMENGKPALFMLKIGKEDVVKELYHRIKELQDDP